MKEVTMAAASAGDVDFMIHGLFSYEIFGQQVWITTTHVSTLVILVVLVGFAFWANRKIKKASAGEAPDRVLNVLELLVERLNGMVEGTMGACAPVFSDYISTVFLFLFFSNISGLFGLRPPTADYATTLALGVITFGAITVTKLRHQRPGQIWADLCSPLPSWLPLWLPINLISEIAVPVSLSLRLFANVLSGTVMLALVYGLLGRIAYVWPAALHLYFDLFSGAIQTYVFCMLTMTYIRQAYGDNENMASAQGEDVPASRS